MPFADESKQSQTVNISGGKVVVVAVNGLLSVCFSIILSAMAFEKPKSLGEWLLKPTVQIGAISARKARVEPVSGDLIEAAGEGVGKKEALLAAKRNAVVQKLGAFIYANTEVKDLVTVRDRILEESPAAYVKVEKILENEIVDGVCHVRILAHVYPQKLWESIFKDLSNLRELLGHRRVVVITPKAKDPGRKAGLDELSTCIKDFLLSQGVRVFKKEFAEVDYREIIEKLGQYLYHPKYEKLLGESNGFVVFVDLNKRCENGKDILKVNSRVRSFGRELVSLPSQFARVGSLKSKLDWEKAASLCAKGLGDLLMQKLTEQVSRFGAGREYLMEFRGFDNAKAKRIRHTLDSMRSKQVFGWLEHIGEAKDVLQFDTAAPQDPQNDIEDALDSTDIACWSYRQDNMLLFVPRVISRWKVALLSFGFTISILLFVYFLLHIRTLPKGN